MHSRIPTLLALLSSAVTIFLLSSCQSPVYPSPNAWGSFKCAASAGVGLRPFVGWSVVESSARSQAISKCRDKTGSSACQVLRCVDES